MTVDLVVPVYNEASRWQGAAWSRLCELPGVRYHVVDDGSTDDSVAIAADIAHRTGGQVITLPTNVGKAEAIRVGLQEVLASKGSGRVVGFMDADASFPCEAVARCVRTAEVAVEQGVDAVWAARPPREGRAERRLGRAIARRACRDLVEPNRPEDTQAGLKLFAAQPELGHVLEQPFRTRWLGDVELVLRFASVTGRPMRVQEVRVFDVTHHAGSTLSGLELARAAKELAVVYAHGGTVRRHLREGRRAA